MPHAIIATHQAIYTLEQLHAELGGKIIDNKAEAKRLAAAMVHVEAVLKLLEPGYDVRPIAVRRRKPNPWFKRGTVWRSVLDVLRAAEGPMTAGEITAAMLAAKRVTNAPRGAVVDLEGAVRAALRCHKGALVAPAADGTPVRWHCKNH
jgi:hypothetical protein